jgi:hypothetical protein
MCFVAQRVQLLEQLEVAFERERRVLADRVERRQEDSEFHAFSWLQSFYRLVSGCRDHLAAGFIVSNQLGEAP